MGRPNWKLENDQIDAARKRACDRHRRRKEARYSAITENASSELLRLTKRTLVADIRERFNVSEKIATEAYAMMARASRLFANPVKRG